MLIIPVIIITVFTLQETCGQGTTTPAGFANSTATFIAPRAFPTTTPVSNRIPTTTFISPPLRFPIDLNASTTPRNRYPIFAAPRDQNLPPDIIDKTPVATPSPECDGKICYRKCCPPGQFFMYYSRRFGCLPLADGEQEYVPNFRYRDLRPAVLENDELQVLWGEPKAVSNCSSGRVPDRREYYLLTDGTMLLPWDTENPIRSNREYCIDNFRMRGIPELVQQAMFCYEAHVETAREIFRLYAHTSCLIISTAALAVLIVFHASIPKLRDLSGLCILSHASSLAVGNSTLITGSIFRSINKGLCTALGIMMQHAYIATYMWLTIMCYDIWHFIRLSVRGIPSQAMGGKLRKFLIYSGVVWGSVAVIAIVSITLHFLPKDSLPDHIIRPHYSVTRCFIIEEDANLLVYFYGILGTLCAVNVCLVVSTMVNLHRGGAPLPCWFVRTRQDSESSVFNGKHIDMFWYRFQIFILTTFLWTTEVLSWKIPPKELWELTDILNTLQGSILLIIFLFQEKKRTLVKELLLGWLGKAQTATFKMSSSNNSTSSTCAISKLEGSDPDTVERIRKLSKMEETAASTIANSLSQNKIDMVGLE